MRTEKCVQCGYCCMKGPCAGGSWDEHREQCEFLTDEKKCSIYDKLKGTGIDPAFGAGCSSTLFNTVREKKILELKKG